MNRFRRKKELKDMFEETIRPSIDSEVPLPPPPPRKKTFRKVRQPQETETKNELDLSNALPPSDNFRTSLLMSSLSARFSMLRELDDPKSTGGDTNDGSLLVRKQYPKNNSLEFCARDLSDISEVSSIHSSLRPRTETPRSSSSGLSNQNDSNRQKTPPRCIMDRARPGEGNILFGGRQKINIGNRILYDADVHLSAFQRQRKQEKESQRIERDKSEFPAIVLHSSSSTPQQSGENTTQLSQNVQDDFVRQKQKNRRLYDDGLDNLLQQQQISSAIRIDTLTRPHVQTVNSFSPVASPTSTLSEQISPATESYMHQLLSFPKGLETNGRSTLFSSSNYGLVSPPLSPPASEKDETPSLASQSSNIDVKIRGSSTSSESDKLYDEDGYCQKSSPQQTGDQNLQKNLPSIPKIKSSLNHFRPSSRPGSDSSYGSGLTNNSSSAQEDPPAKWNYISPPQHNDAPLKGSQPSHKNSPNAVLFDLDLFRRTTNIERPSISEHPMNREQPFVVYPEGNVTESSLQARSRKNSVSSTAQDTPPAFEISKMIRRHMRNLSTASSIYGAVPPVTDDDTISHYPGVDSLNEYLSNANPWGAEWDTSNEIQINTTEENTLKPKDSFSSLPSTKVNDNSQDQIDNCSSLTIKDDIQPNHNRQESTDTQKEREDLRNELASRRRQVQEKMRSFVESDSRSPSPLPLPELIKDGISKGSPFGILRTKTSRSSVRHRDGPLKNMRGFGRGNPANTSTTSLDIDCDEKEVVEVSIGLSRPSPSPSANSHKTLLRELEHQSSMKLRKNEAKYNKHTNFQTSDENQFNLQQKCYTPSMSSRLSTPSESREVSMIYLQPDTYHNGNQNLGGDRVNDRQSGNFRDSTQLLTSRGSPDSRSNLQETEISGNNNILISTGYRMRNEDNYLSNEKLGKKSSQTTTSRSRQANTDAISISSNLSSANSSQYSKNRISPNYPVTSRSNVQNNYSPNYGKISEHTTSQELNSCLHVANFLRDY